MARWCKIPKTFLCEAPDFDKGQDCWPLCDSVFIPICNKRYISKPQNKEIGSVSGKTDSPMSFLSCSLFLWLNPHLDSASFSPLLYLLLHYPFLISLYICNQICIFPKTPTPSPPSNSLDPPGLDPGRKQCLTLFFVAPKSLQMVIADMKLKDAYSLEGKLWPT